MPFVRYFIYFSYKEILRFTKRGKFNGKKLKMNQALR